MKRLPAYDRGGRITVRDCAVCGRDCEPMTFRTRWRKRPANACLDLARAAAELLTAHARSCEEWKHRAEAATRHLWRLLWHTPAKSVDDALASAAVRFIQEHVRDGDIAAACAALQAHRPDIGEAARITGADRATKPRSPHAPPPPPPTVWWVRCDMHGTWCAVGLRRTESKRSFIRHLAAREIVGLRLIAARSRSCEEFRARRARIPSIPRGMIGHDMGFVPAGRGRWVRDDENGAIKLFYSAAVWSTLAPALQPWEMVAMAGLGSANGQP